MDRRVFLKTAAIAGALGTAMGPTAVFAATNAKDHTGIRWDIPSLNFAPPVTVSAGGHASARAVDGSTIKLTGSGTFRKNPGQPQAVTGGGTWETSGPIGSKSGTYKITGFVSFDEAPGTLGAGIDNIGNKADARAGLAKLRVRYSNGQRGVLTVSCHLTGTSDSVFEGITASMGFVDFFNAEAPVANVDANRTLFHRVRQRNEDDD